MREWTFIKDAPGPWIVTKDDLSTEEMVDEHNVVCRELRAALADAARLREALSVAKTILLTVEGLPAFVMPQIDAALTAPAREGEKR